FSLIYSSPALSPLPPFPTRRSSDLSFRSDCIPCLGCRPCRSGSRSPRPHVGIGGHARGGRAADVPVGLDCFRTPRGDVRRGHREDRKSTRLNSSHQIISYAVFCLKK